ncbi:MAG: twin-arginine translocase subunit TatB [Ectothiorhodospiraceae bacterium]|nr:twin-arginine translocase subunit TatB [Ectothiorhodospiraceae bacterium]
MFDVSFQEVFLILLVALLVIGPERLPKVARTLGLWVGRARAMFNTMRNEVEREIQLDELRKTEQQLKRDLDLKKEMKDLDRDLNEEFKEDVKLARDLERDLTGPLEQPAQRKAGGGRQAEEGGGQDARTDATSADKQRPARAEGEDERKA